MTDASVQIGSTELHFLQNGNQDLRGKFLYLKRSTICSKKFQRVHLEPILTSF